MDRGRRRRRLIVACAACACAAALVSSAIVGAQGRGRGGFGGFRGGGAPIAPNTSYDGRFTFVRLRYGPPVNYASQRIPWTHDYPEGEHNLMKIMNEVSYLAPHTAESNVLALDDPELFKYPVAYLAEPGRWFLTDEEARGFRAYLLKGGFAIVDDFRRWDWDNFEAQMRKVLPDARFVDLEATHPIFHAFFEVASPHDVPQYYDAGPPVFRGVYENNDATRRLMVAIAYNTDLSEFWEWSGTGVRPIAQSNESFKLGVNFFMYGLTH